MNSCREFAMFEIIMTAAGPELTHDAVWEAIHGIGDVSCQATPSLVG